MRREADRQSVPDVQQPKDAFLLGVNIVFFFPRKSRQPNLLAGMKVFYGVT